MTSNNLRSINFSTSLAALSCLIAGLFLNPHPIYADTGPTNRKPNIIFIMADDLGYGDLGCYGQERILTPNLDRMAAEGMRFTDCYAGSTVCAPSRCCLMTGLHTGHARIRANGLVPLEPEDITVAEILKTAGYTTGIVGKWGLGEADSTGIPNHQGFDEWFGYLNQVNAHNYYPEYMWRNQQKYISTRYQEKDGVITKKSEYSHDTFTREALKFIDKHKDKTFFLYLPYTIPHANNEQRTKPLQGMEVPSLVPYQNKKWPGPQKGQAAMITRMDKDIGRLFDRLKELNIDENTIVFFTSDNGPHKEGGVDPAFFKSWGPLKGYKRSLHDGGIRVPMIVRWPGKIKAGSVSNHICAFWDFLPTAAEIAGTQPPTDIDGISMLPELLGRKQPKHQYLYWEFWHHLPYQAVRMDEWKAIRGKQDAPIQLYNLKDDIGETKDIAKKHPDIVAKIENYLNNARTVSEHWPTPLDKPQTISKKAPEPNILWITCEDMSPDLGCYGDKWSISPNIDKLAGQGMRYTHAFSISGVCAPSRSALITGMYPTTIGTHHMRCKGVPPYYVKCFPEYLRAAGYYCTNNVKTDYNFNVPVSAWDESSNKAHWRNRPDKNQLFFSVFNFITTHESRIRLPDDKFAELTKRLTSAERHKPTDAVLPPYYPDTPETRKDWANYYDIITAMDKQVGDLLQQLEEDGLADNTIVFFYSDHGRGLPRAKRWLYDSGTHVPLIIRWPGKIEPGTVCEELVSFIDFGPTVLSLAGVKIAQYIQGQAFLGEQKAEPRKYIFGARDRMDETYDIIRCVRDKQYKYLRNFEPEKTYAQRIDYMDQMPTMKVMRKLNAEGKLVGPQKLFFRKTKPVEELYDTIADPHEINNLADSPRHQKTLKRMRKTLQKWMKDTNDLGFIPEPELNKRRLIMAQGQQWSVTAPPRVTLAGVKPDGSAVIEINCLTKGSSAGFTNMKTKWARWKLYTGPINLKNKEFVRFKASRLGYKDSGEVHITYNNTTGKGKKLEITIVEQQEQKSKTRKKKK